MQSYSKYRDSGNSRFRFRTAAVLTEDWNPTYGLGDPRSVDIEVVDFDALCLAIDDFSATFKE